MPKANDLWGVTADYEVAVDSFYKVHITKKPSSYYRTVDVIPNNILFVVNVKGKEAVSVYILHKENICELYINVHVNLATLQNSMYLLNRQNNETI